MSHEKISLPPFKALTAFWAAGTHDRLVDAAAKLGVTESAVSHQIRHLETLLHTALFDRTAGRLQLTTEGQRYLARIEPALREIQAATSELLPTEGRRGVRLTMPPSLAALWLIPRLPRFETSEPDVDVQLVLTTRIVDLRRDQIDLSIRYGRGSWDGVTARFLFDDLATPVAAPGLVPQDATFETLPPNLRLIRNRSIPGEWDEWAKARGIASPDVERSIALDSIEQVLQLAESGHGLAMGRSPYIAERLSTGKLVAPFGEAGPTGAGYYLCHAADASLTAPARKLDKWLRDEAREFVQEG